MLHIAYPPAYGAQTVWDKTSRRVSDTAELVGSYPRSHLPILPCVHALPAPFLLCPNTFSPGFAILVSGSGPRSLHTYGTLV
jgi:hypothetical protein